MSSLILRTPDSEICRIQCGPVLQEFAMRWDYIVRQRHRWAEDSDARQRQSRRLQCDLRRLGVTARHLRRLRGIVEVSVPHSQDDQFWEARIVPWEYVLAASTKPYRVDDEILVVRHLRTGRRQPTRIPDRVLVIETAPGELAAHFSFPAQRQLVTAAFKDLPTKPIRFLENPTATQLGRETKIQTPDLIHVTGLDNRSGRQLLGGDLSGVRDGFYLADGSDDATEYRAEDIASLLNRGSPHPLLVGFQCWNSAARLAPMTIQSGSRLAIGFQHTFDEAVAEIFFLNFYRACVRSQWDILAAFLVGWDSITPYRSRIRGSGIVLWSADSLVLRRRSRAGNDRWRTRLNEPQAKNQPVAAKRSADPSRDSVADLIQVTVRPKRLLNYSSLHNGESVFDQLTLRINPTGLIRQGSRTGADIGGRAEPGEASEGGSEVIAQIDDLELEVQLNVGLDSYPYRTRWNLSTQAYRHDLADRVSLPLNGQLFRSISERIQTSLYVDLRWHDQVLYRHTHAIWLAPIDQWTLEDRQIGWLPSFVQPRDPAVARTIDKAQAYLQCLADRVGVGFDGYQSFDGSASGIERWAGVDRQVRAIWSALLLKTELRYINPPPSYGEFTQRLRTPSDTVDGGFGTCVDLALLLASCLEWVEIHPTLFLLHGHVFPGYWKDLAAHQRFTDVSTDDLPPRGDDGETSEAETLHRWVSGRKTYAELKGYVDRGELVPIETVALTAGKGFAAAIDEGREHFYKKRNRAFRAMIDLVSARAGDGVTPLPIRFPDSPIVPR